MAVIFFAILRHGASATPGDAAGVADVARRARGVRGRCPGGEPLRSGWETSARHCRFWRGHVLSLLQRSPIAMLEVEAEMSRFGLLQRIRTSARMISITAEVNHEAK